MTDCGSANGTESAIETRGAGNLEMSHWNVLPDDLQEHILGKLPLWDVAHMSATSRPFQEIFNRRLKKELKARRDLALEQFGQERIVAIADLIKRCVRGETMDPALYDTSGWIFGWMSADGKLHVTGIAMWWRSREAVCERGDVDLLIYAPERVGDVPRTQIVITWGRDHSELRLSIRKRESVSIRMWPNGHEDLRGVALVQVLLIGGHCPTPEWGNDGHPVTVHLKWWVLTDADRKIGTYRSRRAMSEAGLQTQIAPLMPLASHIKIRDGRGILSFLWEVSM